MKSIAKLSIKYSVLINMLTIAILIFGLYTMVSLPRESNPAVDFGSVIIFANYPGVSPAEMENLVISKIETALSGLDGLTKMESEAEEGRVTIRLDFETSKDPDEAFDEVSREMNKVTDLPSDMDDPTIMKINMREVNPIGQVVFGGDYDAGTLLNIAERLEDGLLAIDYVSKVDIVGTRDKQIWVDADQTKLDAYGISLSDLSSALQGRNLNLPGGTSRFGKIEFLVRTLGEFESVDEISSMIVRSDANGRSILVGEVATVRDTLEKAQTIAKLNGENSVSVYIYKKGDGNIIKVMQDVRNYVDEMRASILGLQIDVRNDGSEDVRNGISALGSSAFKGILLVFLALLIFLGWKNALFAAFGIPLSLFIAFIMMPVFDITLNNLTIFALIIVVGMVVDNAVVVIENIHRLREKGISHKEAIVQGVDQVISPVFSSTLTTVSAFMPLLLMTGMMGKFLYLFPIVVSVALLGSWFQSMAILPNNIHQFGGSASSRHDRTTRMIKPLTDRYRKILTWVLKHRYIAIGSVFAMLTGSLMVLGSGAIPFEFFPTSPSQTLQLQLETPIGTTLEETERVVGQIEDFILTMDEKEDIEFVIGNVGAFGDQGRRVISSNNAQINIDLVELKEMRYSHDKIRNSIRQYLDKLPGLYTYKFVQGMEGLQMGQDIVIRIKGDNIDKLTTISETMINNLKQIPGVTDIEDSFSTGKMEVRIRPNQQKLSMYGLTVAQIASTIRTASAGTEVSKYRGTGLDEYPLIVKLQDKYTQDLETLKDLKIRSNTGELIAIRDLAEFEFASSYSSISHHNEKRVATVSGTTTTYDVNGRPKKRTTQEVLDILFGNKRLGIDGMMSNFEQRYPGYTVEFGGIQEEQSKSYASLARGFILALLAVFTILASQFRSYVQPMVVMMTIPFAFIGVILGLLVTGLSFGLTTLISVVALSGVVVNNAIILIDFINSERDRGTEKWHAIIESGAVRLRPILLTTATTVVGMLPLVFSTDKSAQSWRPLAVSFTFGLLFASILTLFVIPVIYSMVDSFFGKFGMIRFKDHAKINDALETDNTPI